MLLVVVTQHDVCERGPWGNTQVLQGDETIATHMGGGGAVRMCDSKEVLRDRTKPCEG